jgi:hypothetical protein
MTPTTSGVAKVFFALGVFLAILALTCFSMPIIAAAEGTYEGGVQGIGMFYFYILLALPATALIGASIWLRGWKESRAGKIVIVLLFGIPTLIFLIALTSAVVDAIFKKKEQHHIILPTALQAVQNAHCEQTSVRIQPPLPERRE